MAAGAGKRQNGRSPVVPESVLDEAANLFLSNGYYRTRMQDIADSFGVSHAALYYHFQNKQDILAQINIRAIGDLLEGAREIAVSVAEPRARLVELFRLHMTYVALNPALVATFLEHDLEIPPTQFRQITMARREYTEILLSTVGQLSQDDELAALSPMVVISLLIGACNWIYRWYEPDRGLSPDQLVEQGMALLGRVLGTVES